MVDCDGCYVFDSKNATGGLRLLLEQAVKLRDEGKNAQQIMDGVASLQDRIVLYACMDTLEYLYKGGRISQTVYKLGTMAQVKPILRVTEKGSIEVPAKAMGMRKGMDLLCKRLTARKPDGDHPVYVMYTNDRSVAETLAARMESQGLGAVPAERIIQVGAAIGAHIGPGACGIVYVGE
jgi:DegV family protein with EDD domain